jgi:hypothetical protein
MDRPTANAATTPIPPPPEPPGAAGAPYGRIYQRQAPATADVAWFWSITTYVDPPAADRGIQQAGAGREQAQRVHTSAFETKPGGVKQIARLEEAIAQAQAAR